MNWWTLQMLATSWRGTWKKTCIPKIVRSLLLTVVKWTITTFDPRKFRCQAFDLWTDAAVREEKESEEKVSEERVSRKEIKVCEKVETLRNTVFIQCFVVREGRKVGSLKWRVRSHLVA